MTRHPRDRFITVFGRKPVLEVLRSGDLEIARVLIAKGARGGVIEQIKRVAKASGVPISIQSAEQVSRISRRPKQDQGVAADVEAPAMRSVEGWLKEEGDGPAVVLALDHITTPANVGMILRTATVLGLGGVLLARRGSPEIGPYVIKASAGYAFRARVLRCATIEEGLMEMKSAGFTIYGLSDRGELSLADIERGDPKPGDLEPGGGLAARAVLVLGNESDGVAAAASSVDHWIRIPTAIPGDSLNVACAAAIVAWAACGVQTPR